MAKNKNRNENRNENPALTKTLFIAGLLAVLLCICSFANAASIKWINGDGTGSIQSCACEAQRMTAEIVNDGSATQTYSFEADFGSASDKFSSFVASSISIPSNSRRTVTLTAAPACDAHLGDYPFTLAAHGSSGQETVLEGDIRVIECRSIKISIPSDAPVCSGETATLSIEVRNDGETRAKGSVITDLSPNLFTLSDASFDLAPNAKETSTLRVTVPSLTPPGEIPFKINAVASGVYAEAFSQITVLDCSGLRIVMPTIKIEPATSKTQNVLLRNDAAGADVFSLSLKNCPSWVTLDAGRRSISLEPTATGYASLVFNPPNDAAGKDFNCTLTAKSSKRGNSFESTGTIGVLLPSAASLYAPEAGDYCESNGTANYSFSLRNAGDEQGTFDISANGAPGALDSRLASIAPGETKRLTFVVDTRRSGDYALTITAKSAFATATKTVGLHIVKCNAFEAGIEPSSSGFCENETRNFTITINNTGRNPDSYSITAQAPGFAASASGYAVSVAPGASKQLVLSLTAPSGVTAGIRSLTVAIKSNSARTTRTLNAAVELRADASCAGLVGGAGGATGAFTSLYTGLAGFLVALIAGLFVVFVLAGRKTKEEGNAENASEKGSETEDTEAEAKQAKKQKANGDKPKKK